MRAFRIFSFLVLIALPAIAAQEEDAQKIRFVLLLMREDVRFTDGISSSLNELAQEGKIPPDVSMEAKGIISPKNYLQALGSFYVARLSPSEIDELLAYFRVTANLSLYRDLQDAYGQFEGQALEDRRKELAARDPAVWTAAAEFFQSKALVKFVALQKEANAIKLKCRVDAMVAALIIARDHHNAGH